MGDTMRHNRRAPSPAVRPENVAGLCLLALLLLFPSGCLSYEEEDYGVYIKTNFSFELIINTTYNSSITLLLPILMTQYNNQTEIHPLVNVSLANNPDWSNHSFEKRASDTFINLTLLPSINNTKLFGMIFTTNITGDDVLADYYDTEKWISSVKMYKNTIKCYLLTKMSDPIEISMVIVYRERHCIHTVGNMEMDTFETYNNPVKYGLNIFNVTIQKCLT